MEERRKHKRFPVQLSARCLGGSEEEWVNCSVANVSRESMGIDVYLQKRIDPGEILQFKIIMPAKEEPIKTTGELVWIKELKDKMGFVGGIKLLNVASEEIWTLLDHARKEVE